jgi:hypothetical protein
MSKVHTADAAADREPAAPLKKQPFLPPALTIAFILLIGAGVLLLATRDMFAENAAFNAISTSEASVLPEENGTTDFYGMVQFRKNSDDVADLLSLCEMKPEIARRVFHRALKDGNKQARMIAIHSANFLAGAGKFDAEDFKALLARLDPAVEAEADVRKVAQRRISELTILTNVKNEEKYNALPANLPPLGEKAPSYAIRTRKQKIGFNEVLAVRWSNDALASAWWKENAAAGAWDAKQNCFVIP